MHFWVRLSVTDRTFLVTLGTDLGIELMESGKQEQSFYFLHALVWLLLGLAAVVGWVLFWLEVVTTRRNELGMRIKNWFKRKQGKTQRGVFESFNNISAFAEKIASKQKPQVCTVSDINSMSSKKLSPQHFPHIFWKNNKSEVSRLIGFTLASVNPSIHVLPAQLTGYVRSCTPLSWPGYARLYVQLKRCLLPWSPPPLPLYMCTYTVYCLSLGAILCITPHSCRY